jgi:hypothetical protein
MTAEQIAVYAVPLGMILGYMWTQAKSFRTAFNKKFDETYERGEMARKETAKELKVELAAETASLNKKMDDRHTEQMGEMGAMREQLSRYYSSVERLERDVIELRLSQAATDATTKLLVEIFGKDKGIKPEGDIPS